MSLAVTDGVGGGLEALGTLGRAASRRPLGIAAGATICGSPTPRKVIDWSEQPLSKAIESHNGNTSRYSRSLAAGSAMSRSPCRPGTRRPRSARPRTSTRSTARAPASRPGAVTSKQKRSITRASWKTKSIVRSPLSQRARAAFQFLMGDCGNPIYKENVSVTPQVACATYPPPILIMGVLYMYIHFATKKQ